MQTATWTAAADVATANEKKSDEEYAAMITRYAEENKNAPSEIEAFLKSEEGHAGLQLLAASHREICIALLRGEYNRRPWWQEYVLSHNGLREKVAIMEWVPPDFNCEDNGGYTVVGYRDSTPISAEDLLRAVLSSYAMQPAEILPFIKKRLDGIAQEALAAR